MNCVEAERKIYLYEELTVREREVTDRHIATCSQCQAAMERINQERAVLRGLRRLSPPIPDHSKITREIMSHVSETQQAKQRDGYSFPFIFSPTRLRYAMAVLSVFLIAAFGREYNSGDRPQLITKHYPGNVEKETRLDSDSFYKSFSTEKDKPASGSQSVYACLISCLQTPQTDCEDCGNKFSKLN